MFSKTHQYFALGAVALGWATLGAVATPIFQAVALQNGREAQSLNSQFSSLKPSSRCSSGQEACIDSKFAQCVNGQFVLTACGAGTSCFVLPLVNKAGTSITCTTKADALARIEATGAGDSITSSSSSGTVNVSKPPPASAPAAQKQVSTSSSGSGSKPFTLQNGKDAQKLNRQFQSLTASSSCSPNEVACIGGKFAQCVNGRFVLAPCSGGLKCFALPLVNKAGTSVTCDTEADALARIKITGAGNSLTG